MSTKGWDAIPYSKTGEVLTGLPTVPYRLATLKKAMVEIYEVGLPVELHYAITDILADIRHMCDQLNLDFGALDKTAHSVYLNEKGGKQ